MDERLMVLDRVSLIVKLVHERRLRCYYPNIHGTDGLELALRDFGISLEEWKSWQK